MTTEPTLVLKMKQLHSLRFSSRALSSFSSRPWQTFFRERVGAAVLQQRLDFRARDGVRGSSVERVAALSFVLQHR